MTEPKYVNRPLMIWDGRFFNVQQEHPGRFLDCQPDKFRLVFRVNCADGEHVHPDSINNWLRRFAARHDLPKINPHKFRHTMASLLYFNGVDTVAISKRLGHAKVSTTQNFYAHFIKQADEIASECIADSILRDKPPEMPRKPTLLRAKKTV